MHGANRIAAASITAILAVAAAPAAADCVSAIRSLEAATGGPHATLVDLYRRTVVTECDSRTVDQIGRQLARRVIHSRLGPNGRPTEEAIQNALEFGRPWDVLMLAGDAAYDGKDWATALKFYEDALEDMRDTARNPTAPGREYEEYVAKRAYQAKALAPTYLVSRRGTRGEPSGALSGRFRNFTAVKVPVPVRFNFREATLTPDGERAVDEIFAAISSDPSARGIVLVGHTDPRGPDDANLRLSLERAKSVEAALRARGYKGQIKVEGRGKREPFQPDDPARYSEEERFSFDRRVEFTPVKP